MEKILSVRILPEQQYYTFLPIKGFLPAAGRPLKPWCAELLIVPVVELPEFRRMPCPAFAKSGNDHADPFLITKLTKDGIPVYQGVVA